MATPPANIESAIVRIDAWDGTPVGIGTLVSDRHVVTAYSAVTSALNRSAAEAPDTDKSVSIRFIFVDDSPTLVAHLSDLNAPLDVAILELGPTRPADSTPTKFLTGFDLDDHMWAAYGVSTEKPDGEWLYGRIGTIVRQGQFQLVSLDSNSRGWFEPGFSGSPIFDQELNAIVGMMIPVDRDGKVARGLTTWSILEFWPELPVTKLPTQSQEDSRSLESPEELAATFVSTLSQVPAQSEYATIAENLMRRVSAMASLPKGVEDAYGQFLRDKNNSELQEILQAYVESALVGDTDLAKDAETWIDQVLQVEMTLHKISDDAISENVVTDAPLKNVSDDRLGFGVYVRALRDFLLSPETTTPLTVSVDGPWGAGKSSLMRMLQSELEANDQITIWFNAWKFDQEEQLWAALVLSVLDDLRDKYTRSQRFWFWLRLTRDRFSGLSLVWRLLAQFVLPLALGTAALLYSMCLLNSSCTILEQSLNPVAQNALNLTFWLGFLVTAGIQASDIVKDPFQISVSDFLDKPNYRDKIGFIGRFEQDFQRIIKQALAFSVSSAQPTNDEDSPTSTSTDKKLIIFIDDLDRCEPPKAVDIVAAINLFLDSEGCVFVLGMDSVAVIASIEAKYKDLFEVVRKEQVTVVSPGRVFLDKIIQVPFHLPRPTESNIDNLVADIMGPLKSKGPVATAGSAGPVQEEQTSPAGPGGLPQQPGTGTSTQPGTLDISYENTDIRSAIRVGTSLLPENPRQVKRFINLYRLNVYIANQRSLFEEHQQGGTSSGITLDRLAVWVSLSIRWPALPKRLSEETSLQGIRDYLVSLTQKMAADGQWIGDAETSILEKIQAWRTDEESLQPSHWKNLPWEWWILERDFRRATKNLSGIWAIPEADGIDWLYYFLAMTRMTTIPRSE